MIDIDMRQFRDLVQQELSSQDFFRRFVELFSSYASVELGLAWDCSSEPYKPMYQVMRDPDAMVKLPFSSHRHLALLRETHEKGAATMASPPLTTGAPSPTVLLSPIRRDGETAIVEFILPASNSTEENRRIQKLLVQCCRLEREPPSSTANRRFDPVQPSAPSKSAAGFGVLGNQDLDTYVENIHQSLNFRDAAGHIANETRRVLDCDRVTVFKKVGSRFQATAISGQPKVNRRSNTVKLLQKLANVVLATGRAFWFPSETESDFPPQIEGPLNDYIQESLIRSLAIIPVYDRQSEDPIDPTATKTNRKIIGGIIIEQANNQWDQSTVAPQIEALTRHAGNALRNAHEVNSIFLYPVWNAIGKLTFITQARNLGKWMWGAAAAVALALAMILLPASFDLSCEGELVPIRQQHVFAEQSGKVASIHVAQGDQVGAGDILLKLENEDLEIEIEQVQGELSSLKERLIGSRSIRINTRNRDESGPEKVNQRELQTQIASLKRRLATLRTKQEQLTVVAPIAGQVLTWDIENLLKNRPVQQGSLLIEVADTSGPWELQLDLPDRKVGHLFEALRSEEQPLEVRFTMATDPTRELVGSVREVANSTTLNEDSLNVFRIKVDVEPNAISDLKHTGSSVSAKVHCGKRRLGFVWLHDAWEFLQYRVWFRLFG